VPIFFFVHIFVDSFETYDTSILQMRHEKHKGEKNANFEGLKLKLIISSKEFPFTAFECQFRVA